MSSSSESATGSEGFAKNDQETVVEEPRLDFRDPESIRAQYARLEAHVKGVGIYDWLLAAIGVWILWSYVDIAVRVAQGLVTAPWLTSTSTIAYHLATLAFVPLCLLSGWGLLRLRPWAPKTQRVLAISYATYFYLALTWSAMTSDYYKAIQHPPLAVLICAPLFSLWNAGRTHLFSPEYQQVRTETRHRLIVPRLSLRVVTVMVVALVLFGLADAWERYERSSMVIDASATAIPEPLAPPRRPR